MGVAFSKTIFLMGLSGIDTVVEADVRRGMPSFKIVGLPTSAVEEARERVVSAIKNSGVELGARKVVINLSPADVPKRGSHADLPIAVSLLKAMNVLESLDNDIAIFGELALDGSVRATASMFALIAQAVSVGYKKFVVPIEAEKYVNAFSGITYKGISTLRDLFSGEDEWKISSGHIAPETRRKIPDFSDVSGQYMAKYAAMLAVAGMHNMVMIGSPGVGKTMIAERIPYIFPDLTQEEIIEITGIYSATLGEDTLITQRPFRAPHSNISSSAMFGGGRNINAGEVTLAHRGVLFVDEFPEFRRDVLEGLRTVIEKKRVTISRADIKLVYPADFLLVMASNPCPCGYLGHPTKQCRCSVSDIKRYQRKFSGPLMQRMDIQMWMAPPDDTEPDELTTSYIREKVLIARDMQKRRYGEGIYNGTVDESIFRSRGNFTGDAEATLWEIKQMGKDSGRDLSKIARIARTIADIEEREEVSDEDVWFALNFRKAMDVMVRFW